jgi:hypothetical protein
MSDADGSQDEFRFEGTIFTGGRDAYRVVPLCPAWLNPWRWQARRRAAARVTPGVYDDAETYTGDRWALRFRLTDIALSDMDDHFTSGWTYTLRLAAIDRSEAADRAETFLDSRDAADYTISACQNSGDSNV